MEKIRRPTIDDVAREAGVGTTTVSRVINGGKLVGPETRKRVEDAVRRLRYQPSSAARSLAQERNQSIGIILPRLIDPFFAHIASVVHGVCRAHNYVLSIAISLDIEEQMLTELAVLEQQRVEGIIMFPPPTYNTPFLDYCHRFRERIVTIGLPIIGASVSGVQTNNIEATAKATKHLLEHGCKRILFLISNPQLQSMQERRQGYEQAMAQAGLKPLICEKLDSFETTEAAIVRAYRSRGSIDGLLTANGVLGVYAFQALQKHRIAIPKKVAFISFDDFELADTLRPAVTCIAQPVEELARIAMELLFTQLKAQRPRSRKIELPGELVIRTSCGCK